MGMKLNSVTLRGLAEELKKLEELNLDVERFKYGNHTVFVKREDSQTDGVTFSVIGISDSKSTGNLRSGPERSGSMDGYDGP